MLHVIGRGIFSPFRPLISHYKSHFLLSLPLQSLVPLPGVCVCVPLFDREIVFLLSNRIKQYFHLKLVGRLLNKSSPHVHMNAHARRPTHARIIAKCRIARLFPFFGRPLQRQATSRFRSVLTIIVSVCVSWN